MSSKCNVISNCCKYKLNHADLYTRQLSGTHLLGNTPKIVPARRHASFWNVSERFVNIYIVKQFTKQACREM